MKEDSTPTNLIEQKETAIDKLSNFDYSSANIIDTTTMSDTNLKRYVITNEDESISIEAKVKM